MTLRYHNVICRECRRTAATIYTKDRVADYFGDDRHTANDMARDDGTYSPISHTFLCTLCYIRRGMPLRGDPHW